MPEEIVRGRSLEEIREEWAGKLKLSPEDITLEVMEKPGFFFRQWKVRLIWQDHILQEPLLTLSQVNWDGTKYVISLSEGVKQFRPFLEAGEVWLNGKRQDKSFQVSFGDQVEFHPITKEGNLSWELQVRFSGLSVVAKVRHELPGHYILPKDLPALEEIDLEKYVTWESLPAQGEIWDEARLNGDLEQINVVHGRRSDSWQEILAVEGRGEVVVAEATLTVPSEHAQLEDFVGNPQVLSGAGAENIDFFASKVELVEEGAVLARKIPVKVGIPGKDVFGKVLPVAAVKDFQFRPKKNVYLSDDGLEVIAACGGQPIRVDERTYMVENVYVRHTDVDIATGSIKFPGDVFVNGNVQDGLHVFAGGKLEIRGSVSHAELRAEKGAKIHQNMLGGKIIIGEKFVVRSELLRSVSELRDQLNDCLRHTEELIKAPGAINMQPGQCLKIIIERRFPELPKLCTRVEKFLMEHKDDEMVTEGLVVTLRTAKHFLVGLGPIDIQALPYLQRVDEILEQFIETMILEIPDKLSFEVSYVQGATIECGGSFECQKGIYNSEIRVEGDVKIEGVCRGGKIFAGGNVKIHELGGSGVSSTFVQISFDSHLSVGFCHPNVIVAVGKEIIKIEEAYKRLEIYRENGRVEVESIRANPV
ncbi:MAG TPA: FapA family protein [Desulfosporosinus sp.]|nr:FapA family protein [Desulfosporosinus sp.]